MSTEHRPCGVERALREAPANALPEALIATLRLNYPRVAAVRLLLADYHLRSLLPVGPEEPADPVRVHGTAAGRAFATGRVVTEDGAAVSVPVTARGDRLGVLAITLSAPAAEDELLELGEIGRIAGGALKVAWPLTDRYERARRRRRLTLAAELQWQLLPGQSMSGDRFTVGGHLEPAYSIGGDNYDWVAEQDQLTLSVTNGAGTGTQAALLTSLVVGALRNARRSGADLAEQASLANDMVHARHGGKEFTETLLIGVDLTSGAVTVVDAGSPRILRMRGTQVTPIELDQQLPLGMFADTEYRPQRFALEPGDRLVICSDGVYSAASQRGDDFGAHLLEQTVRRTRLQDAAAVPLSIVGELMDFQGEHDLGDDAIVVCLDWHDEAARR
ncbi:PP2C family protein-serine/threonine phosphatase [Actinomadura parmotrematis]|uniref:Serine/threonine-protein phosphatase n=1 Tax=Actinomadura parmotrematis TaxID=2864039 RepID=A0ABS7G0W2_9ACTN|nr:PP2C family protein-serine/threonine phosphatase [Actinomadura parmotrematis]MBW8486181.1 serine/threonine-protein phosphatase [Actinomadura parmotrematis]